MAKGGARPGAGRKPGKTLDFRTMLQEKDPEAINKFIEYISENYQKSERVMIWMGDHIFGKAPQPMDITTDGEAITTDLTGTDIEKIADGVAAKLYEKKT